MCNGNKGQKQRLTSGWGGLPGSLGGQLLPRGLASGGFTSGLLGTGHFGCTFDVKVEELVTKISVGLVNSKIRRTMTIL